jgi:hypothetical protein
VVPRCGGCSGEVRRAITRAPVSLVTVSNAGSGNGASLGGLELAHAAKPTKAKLK